MSKQLSLAELRAKAIEAADHVFCCSLPLYVLLEKRPRPDAPDWVEVGCLKQGEAEGMMVYLSPMDAMIDLGARNRCGGRYQIFPFESIDPRAFIDEHHGWLTVYLVYGYAARGQRLLIDEQGEPMSLVHGTHFQIAPDMGEHFHLQFDDRVLTWLDRIHEEAGMPDYNLIAREHANSSSAAELSRLAQDARSRIEHPDTGRDNTTHCALFDPVELRWRFVAFADLNALGCQ